jgi:hypothetical protein
MVCLCQLLKRIGKNRSGNAKLFQPFFDGLCQHARTLSRQTYEDVRSSAGTLHEIICLGTIDKLDGAVVMTSKLLRKRADGGLDAFGKAADRKKQLILSWFDSGGFCRLVAEVQILLDVVPEFSQRPVIGILGSSLGGAQFVYHGTISCHEIRMNGKDFYGAVRYCLS